MNPETMILTKNSMLLDQPSKGKGFERVEYEHSKEAIIYPRFAPNERLGEYINIRCCLNCEKYGLHNNHKENSWFESAIQLELLMASDVRM